MLRMSTPKFALARAYSQSTLECAYFAHVYTNHANQIW